MELVGSEENPQSIENSPIENTTQAIETQENTAVQTENSQSEPKVETDVVTEVETKAETDVEAKPVVEVEAKVEAALLDYDKEILLAELRQYFDHGKALEVDVLTKTIGGLRVGYKNMPLFLPLSHLSTKRSLTDEEIDSFLGKKLLVNIYEIKTDEDQIRIVVSRKKIIEEEFWNSINVGDRVTGKVTSTPNFGVFIDLGGVEGLIHVSKLSRSRVDNPANFCKKGDKLEAIVIEINRETKKISLSREELEPSPWIGAETQFPNDSVQKGIVRRLTEFGAYIELKSGVDGLLRNNEISWTKRINNPNQVLKIGDEIDVKIVNISEEKSTASLSIKRVNENPWSDIPNRFPINSVYFATVVSINNKGVIFALNEDIDGFMPKSKIKGKNAPQYKVGDKVEVAILEIDAENESFILMPPGMGNDENDTEESYNNNNNYQGDKKERFKGRRDNRDNRDNRGDGSMDKYKKKNEESSFSLGDLLNQSVLESLNKIN